MAYYNKYYLKFESVFLDDIYEFYIQERDYGGSQSNVVGTGNPISLKWYQSGDDKFDQVLMGSTLTVRLLTDSSETQFDEMFTTDSRKYKGLLYKNTVLIWSGYGMTENYGRPYYCNPFEIELTFTDGLGLLKDIPFNEHETFGWNTPQRLSKILALALYQTDLNLPVYESVNIYEENMSSGAGDSMFYQTYMYPRAFRELSCYDVLERVLKGSRLCQRNGAWWIVRIDELKANIIYRKWDYLADMMGGDPVSSNSTENLNISLSGATASKASLNIFTDHSQYKEWKGGWKKLILWENYGYNGNLIKDYENFTAYGNIDYSITNDELRIEGNNPGGFDNNAYIEYDLGNVETKYNQRLKITIKGIALGNIVLALKIEPDAGGTYWLSDSPNNDGYYIFTSQDYFLSEQYTGEQQEISFECTTDTLTKKYFTLISNTIDFFPANVKLRIYKPYPSYLGTVDGLIVLPFEKFKVEIISDSEGIEEKDDITRLINEDNNIVPDDIEVYITDSNQVANDTLIYDNLLYRYDSGYILTQRWKKRNSDNIYSYNGALINEIVWQYETEWIKLTGMLICHFDILKTPVEGTNRYMIADAEFSPKFDRWDVIMLQFSSPVYLITEEEYVITEDEQLIPV